jgi:hypothetical protein
MVCGLCHANVSRSSHELQGYTFGLQPDLIQDSGGFCQIVSSQNSESIHVVCLQGRVLTPRPFFFCSEQEWRISSWPGMPLTASPPGCSVRCVFCLDHDKNDSMRLAATVVVIDDARLVPSCFLPLFPGRAIRKLRDPVIGLAVSSRRGICLAQQPRRYIPVFSGIGDHGDGLFVITSQDSEHHGAAVGMEPHSFAYAETQHRGVRAHLVKEPEASHNLVVQGNEFFFGKRINIDLAHGLPSNRMLILHRKIAFRNKIALLWRLRVPPTSGLRLSLRNILLLK